MSKVLLYPLNEKNTPELTNVVKKKTKNKTAVSPSLPFFRRQIHARARHAHTHTRGGGSCARGLVCKLKQWHTRPHTRAPVRGVQVRY